MTWSNCALVETEGHQGITWKEPPYFTGESRLPVRGGWAKEWWRAREPQRHRWLIQAQASHVQGPQTAKSLVSPCQGAEIRKVSSRGHMVTSPGSLHLSFQWMGQGQEVPPEKHPSGFCTKNKFWSSRVARGRPLKLSTPLQQAVQVGESGAEDILRVSELLLEGKKEVTVSWCGHMVWTGLTLACGPVNTGQVD